MSLRLRLPFRWNQNCHAVPGLQVEESLLTVQDDGTAYVSLVNVTGFTQTINSGTSLGMLSEIDEEIQQPEHDVVLATVSRF